MFGMHKKEIGTFISGVAGNAIFYFSGYVINIIPTWLSWLGFIVSTLIFFYGTYLIFFPTSRSQSKNGNDTKKRKILKKVISYIEYDNKGIYVIVENRERKIDVYCSKVAVYEINKLEESLTFFQMDLDKMMNSIRSLGAVLPPLPHERIEDIAIFIEHKSKEEMELLAVKSSKNQLVIKTRQNEQEVLTKGRYSIVIGIEVYPQEEEYSHSIIYKTIEVEYHGKAKLEVWESEISENKDDKRRKYAKVKSRDEKKMSSQRLLNFFKKSTRLLKPKVSPSKRKSKTSE